MKQPRIEITAEPQSDEVGFITRQIIDFNRNRAGEENSQHLAIFLRDANEQIVGGLVGKTYWQWLYIHALWVQEYLRGKGLGNTLLYVAEQEAVKRGCCHAYLDTFGFQAPKFYQKRGYVVFGELQDFPPGCSRYFLKKELHELSHPLRNNPVGEDA